MTFPMAVSRVRLSSSLIQITSARSRVPALNQVLHGNYFFAAVTLEEPLSLPRTAGKIFPAVEPDGSQSIELFASSHRVKIKFASVRWTSE